MKVRMSDVADNSACVDESDDAVQADNLGHDFGDEGLVTAADSICFDIKSGEIETRLRDSTKFSNSLNRN